MANSISKQKKKGKIKQLIKPADFKKKSKAVSSIEDTFKLVPVSIADVSVKQTTSNIYQKSQNNSLSNNNLMLEIYFLQIIAMKKTVIWANFSLLHYLQ